MSRKKKTISPVTPKGKWLNEFGGDYRCSKCHKIIEIGVRGKTNITQFYYCPNCGAEMSGGEEDE